MSENLETGESDVIQPAGFAPEPEATAHAAKSGRVARSASSDGKPASVPPSSRPSRHHGTPRARRMNLSVTHISAWSVAKVTFLLAIAGGIIQVVAAALVWGTILPTLNKYKQYSMPKYCHVSVQLTVLQGMRIMYE